MNMCLISDAFGAYIGQHFAKIVDRDVVTGVDAEQWAILEAGPEHDEYCDVWGEVLDGATVGKYSLHQDGDLWLLEPVEACGACGSDAITLDDEDYTCADCASTQGLYSDEIDTYGGGAVVHSYRLGNWKEARERLARCPDSLATIAAAHNLDARAIRILEQ